MSPTKKLFTAIAFFSLVFGLASCNRVNSLHTADELLPKLLTVSDMPKELNSSPVEWNENMRKVIKDPTPPWENTLDPYLCAEAGTPEVLTQEQAQLELTGGSIMEILLSSKDAKTLYAELDDAYKKCTGTTTPAYTALSDVKKVGDESSSYKSADGVVTIARFDKDIMILKWWVGKFYDQVASEYPAILEIAATRVTRH